MTAQFKRYGDSIWRTCKNSSNVALNFISGESTFGYSTGDWYTGGLLDGEYELRLFAQCTITAGAQPGFDESSSHVIVGLKDLESPRQFGFSEVVSLFPHTHTHTHTQLISLITLITLIYIQPADQSYFPGDEISVSFDEAIRCQKAHTSTH